MRRAQAGSGSGAAVAAPAAGRASIVVDHVSKTYVSRRGPVHAVDDVSFSVAAGSFVSLLGPSGCGKSTLLRIVAGLDQRSSGTVQVDGKQVDRPQTQMGIVFQSPLLLEWRDALANVMLQAEARRMDPAAATRHATDLLASVGLAGSEGKRPSELSGGMQQRVAICRALLHDPDIILMDEPFGALDALTRDQMNVDLQQLWSTGEKSVLFVTHSIAEAVFLSDRVLVMSPAPGTISLDLAIDLPRPRRLAVRDEPRFAEHTHQIRDVFASAGVLREH